MKLILILLSVFNLSIAKEKFIRQVLDYDKGGGVIQLRFSCVRNPPLNRCSDNDFISMAQKKCDPEKYSASISRRSGCIKDPKQDYKEVCNSADVLCKPIPDDKAVHDDTNSSSSVIENEELEITSEDDEYEGPIDETDSQSDDYSENEDLEANDSETEKE